MENQPHQPERDPELEKTTSSDSSGSGDDQRRSDAYTEKPAFDRPRKRGWFLVLAAAGLGAALTIGNMLTQHHKTPPSTTPVATAADERPMLLVSMQDRDETATKVAKDMIERGGPELAAPKDKGAIDMSFETNEAAQASKLAAARDGAAAKTPEIPFVPAPPAAEIVTKDSLMAQLQHELASAPDSVREAIRSGEMQMFTFRFVDWADEDGDVVSISVDGNPLGQVMIGHSGQALTIPLKQGKTHVLTITGVRDGGGGITFGLQSSMGRVDARAMTEGQSESWQIGFEK